VTAKESSVVVFYATSSFYYVIFLSFEAGVTDFDELFELSLILSLLSA